MITAKQRRRIHGMLADVVLIELWMAEELDCDDEVKEAELMDAFTRIQARMLVVQAILWPDEVGPEEEDNG